MRGRGLAVGEVIGRPQEATHRGDALPDGTGATQVVKEKSGGLPDRIRNPVWSADSKFLFYRYYTVNDHKVPNTYSTDLYIVGIDGDGKRCVTSGLDTGVSKLPVAWR